MTYLPMKSAKNEEVSLRKIRVFLKTFRWFSPTNLVSEKEKFFKDKNYNPQLSYPKLPMDKLKGFAETLESFKINNNNPLLFRIRTQRLKETRLKLQLFLALGNPEISDVSKKLYCLHFNKEYLVEATKDALIDREFKPQESLDSGDTAKEIVKYLQRYKIDNWRVWESKSSDFYFQVRPKKKLISISKAVTWDYANLDCVFAHEIDGHVIRALNSHRQKDLIFRENFPFYIKTEEGLACYLGDYLSENGGLSKKHHAIKYLAGYFAKTHSFRETYEFLLDYGFTKELAFQRTFRLKRGFADTGVPGVFAREAMYYEGMLEVKNYLDKGGDIRKLYAGKVGLDHLDSIPIPKNQVIPTRLVKFLN